MRKKLLQLSALLCLSLTNSLAETRIMVISDAHVLPNEYKAALDSLGDNKLSDYSTEILDKATDNVIEAKPDLLLVCGDLTFYGEKSGHTLAHNILKKVDDAGIPVMVIPGNHDILNPYSLDPNKATLTPEEFAEFYKDMGYEDGIERDTNSLSWAKSINDKLAIIAVDGNIYDGEYHSDGCLRTSTLNWMKAQADSFHNQGKMVIGMCHYEIMDHFEKPMTAFGLTLNVKHSTMLPNSIVNISNTHQPQIVSGIDTTDVTLADVQRAFADADINYVITGHFHVQNIASQTVQKSDGSDFELYDISNGGLTTYPCWMRTLNVNEDANTLSTTSSMVEMPLDSGKYDLQTKAKEAVSILNASTEKYGFTISGLIDEFMAEESYELYDATEVYQQKDYSFSSLKYTRIFDDYNWQPLFVPIETKYSDWSQNFDIALISYSKIGAMFFDLVTEADKELPANILALIRLKSNLPTGRYSIVTDSTSTTIEPDTAYAHLTDYEVIGTYKEVSAINHYVQSGDSFVLTDTTSIKPMRWYFDNKTTYDFESVTVYIDNQSAVVDFSNIPVSTEGKIFRIDGRQVSNNENLPNGIYIINGKKTLIKK